MQKSLKMKLFRKQTMQVDQIRSLQDEMIDSSKQQKTMSLAQILAKPWEGKQHFTMQSVNFER